DRVGHRVRKVLKPAHHLAKSVEIAALRGLYERCECRFHSIVRSQEFLIEKSHLARIRLLHSGCAPLDGKNAFSTQRPHACLRSSRTIVSEHRRSFKFIACNGIRSCCRSSWVALRHPRRAVRLKRRYFYKVDRNAPLPEVYGSRLCYHASIADHS